VTDVQKFGLEQIEVLIVNVEKQLIGCRIRRAVCVGPFVPGHFRQFLVAAQEIVTVSEGRQFGNKLDALRSHPVREFKNLLLLEESAVSRVLMAGILLASV